MRDIETLRAEIDRIDREIQRLFEERMAIADEVAAYKKAAGRAVLDREREEALLNKLKERASDGELGKEIVRLYERMLEISRDRQTGKTEQP